MRRDIQGHDNKISFFFILCIETCKYGSYLSSIQQIDQISYVKFSVALNKYFRHILAISKKTDQIKNPISNIKGKTEIVALKKKKNSFTTFNFNTSIKTKIKSFLRRAWKTKNM